MMHIHPTEPSMNPSYRKMTDQLYAKVLEASTRYKWPVNVACAWQNINPAEFIKAAKKKESDVTQRKIRKYRGELPAQHYISDHIQDTGIRAKGTTVRKIERMAPGQI